MNIFFNKNKHWFSKDLLGFSLASFFNDFSHEMTTAILPIFVTTLVGASQAPAVLGLMSGISNAAASFMKLLSGWLSDRITRHKWLLVIGYGLTPLFSALIGTAHYAWQIIVYRTIGWIGRGLREPPRDAWLAAIAGKQHYGKAFGFQRAFDTLGALIGPLIVFFIINQVPLRTIFFVSIIPGIFSVLAIIFLITEQPKKDTYAYKPFFTQFKELPRSFIYFVVIRTIFTLANFDRTLLILRAQEMLTGGKSTAIIATSWAIGLYAFFNLVRAISEYTMGTLSDYGYRKWLLAFVGFGLFALLCAGLIFASSSVLIWLLLFMVAGISTATVTTLEKAYAADLLPDNLRGTGYGLLQATDGMGTLIGNVVFGFIWHSFAATYAFLYAGILSMIAMVLLLPAHSKLPKKRGLFYFISFVWRK